jgi:hypothetical protein
LSRGKSSPDALGERWCKNSFEFLSASMGLSARGS